MVRPGRFLLTGSTNFLTVPTISESLAGRAAIVQLLASVANGDRGADNAGRQRQ